MKYEFKCIVTEITTGTPERIFVYTMKTNKGEELKLELPERIVKKLPEGIIAQGSEALLIISTDEINVEKWDLVMTGVVYLKKREDNVFKTFISIGGLILRIFTPYELDLQLLQKVNIGVKGIK